MKLKRSLGFWSVFCIASGAMISSGLFVLPGLAYKLAGPAMVVAYAIAALMAIPAAMSKSELATAMPRSGGSYFFVERSMGALPGTLAGLANWFSISLKAAFALIGIGAFARLVWPDTSETTIKLVAMGCCVFFATLNILSLKHAGGFQVVMVGGLITILAMFIVTGVPQVKHEAFRDFMREGGGGLLATAGLVFISFGGLTKVADISGEVRHPGRTVPAGIISALIVVSLLYVAAVFVAEGTLAPDQLYDADSGYLNLTPLSTAAGSFLGRGGMIVLSAAAMLAFITTANSGIMTASRSPMAMSHDGLLPNFLRRLSRRFRTPYVSILLTSAFMIAIIALLTIENLVKVASTMMLMLFLLDNLAVIVMRSSKLLNYRPLFRSPFFPWMQLAGIAMYLLLIFEMGPVPLATTACFCLLAALWYIVYVRPRTSRESALLYLARSAVSKEIYRGDLEDELREIALERDEVTQDRFDRLVQDCPILDLSGVVDAEVLFRRSADELGGRLGIDEQRLLEMFRAREKESSTVIQPGLAIPHVIVPGKGLFEILLVRCKEGVRFAGQDEPVRMAFVLVGSRDERNYHLRALMTIAHIVQEPRFTERWLAAPTGENLRDLVLLAERQRDV